MDAESWVGPFSLFTILAVIGGAVLLVRDWMAKRERRGQPTIPPALFVAILIMIGVVMICFIAFVVGATSWH
jgi:hypothetical protein